MMTSFRKAVGVSLSGVATILAFNSCDRGVTEPTLPPGTFAQLQRAVLTPTCATSGCHVAASAKTSGELVLTADRAYQELVQAVSTNLNARNDGVRRVIPFQPDNSLLYQKILAANNAHNGAYGGMMPVGGALLTIGQIEFIRRWIEAGAPDTGFVADSNLLRDVTPQVSAAFTPLSPPPAGTGFQVKVDAFTVQPNFERELFEFRPLGNAQKVYVNRIQTSMRPFSHHFLLYTMDTGSGNPFCSPTPNVVRDIRLPNGQMDLSAMAPMSCHVFAGGSMVPQAEYSFPAGVALELPANTSLDLNVHYANKTASVVPGEAYANIYTVPAASVSKVAHPLNLSNTSFSIPPLRDTTISKTFTFSQTTTIFGLTSHMHARGTRFEIRIVGGARNGESVYVNTDWEHPQFVTFATPIVLQAGEGLRSIVTWHNESTRTITFGLQSTDEMAIIFGYYY